MEISWSNRYVSPNHMKIMKKRNLTKLMSLFLASILAIPTPELRKIVKEIAKGNYISFLDNFDNSTYENTIINVMLINKREL